MRQLTIKPTLFAYVAFVKKLTFLHFTIKNTLISINIDFMNILLKKVMISFF